MEQLLAILQTLRPGIDYTNCHDLIDGRRLDSMTILALVAELEDAFDISIPSVEIIPENFNSAPALWAMVTRLQEENG